MMKKATRAIRARRFRTGAAAVVIATVASVGFNTLAADAATPSNQMDQYGTVHSCTTNQYGSVYTEDGGYVWMFDGSGGPGTHHQIGVVHSQETNGNANVVTNDGGEYWDYLPNSGPLACSAP
jgi:anaerobic selenocysteine-containing dehydrogenase